MRTKSAELLRNKIKTWRERLNTAGYPAFHGLLKQFSNFLGSNSTLVGVLDGLKCGRPAKAEIDWLFHFDSQFTPIPVYCDDEKGQAYLGYQVIKQCAEWCKGEVQPLAVELEVARKYHPNPGLAALEWQLTFFKSFFIEPLCAYIEENLEINSVMLGLLLRYKHKCEWFGRERLDGLWKSDTKRAEWLLKEDLYEYLHDNEIEFTIDPYSKEGKPDLVAAQSTDDPLIADAKLFQKPKSKGVRSVVGGFHQVYRYTQQFNEPFGYLIIFKACDEDLKFDISDQTFSVPYVVYNNRTIYLLTIDIYPNPTQASKRGPLKPIAIINSNDLTGGL
jgi:hypothetical protein